MPGGSGMLTRRRSISCLVDPAGPATPAKNALGNPLGGNVVAAFRYEFRQLFESLPAGGALFLLVGRLSVHAKTIGSPSGPAERHRQYGTKGPLLASYPWISWVPRSGRDRPHRRRQCKRPVALREPRLDGPSGLFDWHGRRTQRRRQYPESHRRQYGGHSHEQYGPGPLAHGEQAGSETDVGERNDDR